MKDLSPIEIAKFWMLVKIDKTTKIKYTHDKCLGHCWIWQGSFYLNGYGRMGINNKSYHAHRISYYLVYGEISRKNLICHKCDNPACVNPEHLFQGTSKDNIQDMVIKGRQNKKRKKTCNTSSKYYGVTYRKENNKWRVRLQHNHKFILVGQYNTEIEGAIAYDDYIKINGIDKLLNFP